MDSAMRVSTPDAHGMPAPAARAGLPAVGTGLSAASFRFQSLVLSEPRSLARGRGATLGFSLFIHVVLAGAAIVLPLSWYDDLPAPGGAVRAFFVSPPDAAPPPPPPPPPSAGVRPSKPTPVEPRPEEARFVAPVEVPAEIRPEESLDLGVEGGVPGGVEGGVPGGVVGGIVGGLPDEAPAPPKKIRVGGLVTAPRLVHRVDPVYPALAAQARVTAVLILEAEVDTRGHVQEVRVLRGKPLFDDVAVAAVRQWRYQPLLLNGAPTEFIVTVTLVFKLQDAAQATP